MLFIVLYDLFQFMSPLSLADLVDLVGAFERSEAQFSVLFASLAETHHH